MILNLEKSKDVTELLKQLKGALEQKQAQSIDVEVTESPTVLRYGFRFGDHEEVSAERDCRRIPSL